MTPKAEARRIMAHQLRIRKAARKRFRKALMQCWRARVPALLVRPRTALIQMLFCRYKSIRIAPVFAWQFACNNVAGQSPRRVAEALANTGIRALAGMARRFGG